MKLNMQGQLSKCLLLAYRTPALSVRHLLPAGLELMTHGPWAFWNVVVCEVEKMRPMHMPALSGINYQHVAYRLYVKAATQTQGRLRGLHFLRSDANHCLIAKGGNLMSDFRFHGATINIQATRNTFNATIDDTSNGEGNARVRARRGEAALTADSCFDSYEQARAMLKYQPLGLSVSSDGRWLKLAEVFRDEDAWHESTVQVEEASFSFFDQMKQRDLYLELATRIAPLAYRWQLGRRVRLATDPVVDHELDQPTDQGFSTGNPASFQAR